MAFKCKLCPDGINSFQSIDAVKKHFKSKEHRRLVRTQMNDWQSVAENENEPSNISAATGELEIQSPAIPENKTHDKTTERVIEEEEAQEREQEEPQEV